MKSINVSFESIDETEIAIRTLKNKYKFSYSLRQSLNQDINVENEIFPSFYNSGNNGLLYSAINFDHYRYQSLNNQSQSHSNNKVILKIKCENKLTDILIDSLYNLGGRNIKLI